jgi:hypothetical protein
MAAHGIWNVKRLVPAESFLWSFRTPLFLYRQDDAAARGTGEGGNL